MKARARSLPGPAVAVSVLAHAALLWAAVSSLPPPPIIYQEEAIALEFAAVRGVESARPAKAQPSAPAPPVPKAPARTPPPSPIPSPFAPPAPAAEPSPARAAAPPQSAPAAAASPGRADTSTTTAARAEPAPVRHGVRDGMDVDAPHGKGVDYMSRLRSWIEAHKTYPKRAKMMRMTGVITVRFALDRTGRLLACEIVSGSGHADLDREALAMLHRATPFPAPPHTVRGERIEVTTPIEFSLR